MPRKSKELKRAIADRDYWRSLVKSDEWELIGFTFRESALFGQKNGRGSVDVTRGHLELLGIEKPSC